MEDWVMDSSRMIRSDIYMHYTTRPLDIPAAHLSHPVAPIDITGRFDRPCHGENDIIYLIFWDGDDDADDAEDDEASAKAEVKHAMRRGTNHYKDYNIYVCLCVCARM